MTTHDPTDSNQTSVFNRQNMAVNPELSTATAQWATDEEISQYHYDPTQNIWLGTLNHKSIGFEDDRHILTIAGSRAGKGRSAIIPTLLDYPQSVFVLDPKGENASITAVRRGEGSEYIEGMGQQVAVLDPFRVADVPENYRASFNPLEWFPDGDGAIYETATLADSFIMSDNKSGDDHWNESARNVIQAIILHVKTGHYFKNDQRDLITCRQLLMEGDTQSKANIVKSIQTKIIELESPDDPDDINPEELEALNDQLDQAKNKHPFDYLISSMLKNTALNGFISQWAGAFTATPPNERGSILSTARRHTSFLDGESMASILKGKSSFDLAQLRQSDNGFSLYLCLPPRYLASHGRWLRAMLSQAINTFERIGTVPHGQRRCLFVLDECASLGYMNQLEKSAGLIAGYGIKLWFVFQDLGQLKKNYRESWETFIGNAGVLQAFGVTDKTTTDYLSARLGKIEIERQIKTNSKNSSIAQGTTQGESFASAIGLTSGEGSSTTKGKTQGRNTGQGENQGFAPGEKDINQQFIDTGKTSNQGFNESFNEGTGTNKNTGRSSTDTTGRSSGSSLTNTSGEGSSIAQNYTQSNLRNADEIAQDFARETYLQLIIIQGQRPMVLERKNYDEYDYFIGKYHNPLFSLEQIRIKKEAVKIDHKIKMLNDFIDALTEDHNVYEFRWEKNFEYLFYSVIAFIISCICAYYTLPLKPYHLFAYSFISSIIIFCVGAVMTVKYIIYAALAGITNDFIKDLKVIKYQIEKLKE